jgi:hypothetical protein
MSLHHMGHRSLLQDSFTLRLMSFSLLQCLTSSKIELFLPTAMGTSTKFIVLHQDTYLDVHKFLTLIASRYFTYQTSLDIQYHAVVYLPWALHASC